MDIVEQLRIDRENGARRLESEYKAGLLTLARRLCADGSDAEELVNRTFAEVIRSIDRYAEQSAFFGWMARILVNLHGHDTERKSATMVVSDQTAQELATAPDADDQIFREVDAAILRDAIEGLPEDMRKTLVSHYFLGLSVSEVARLLSTPSGTVKWRLQAARRILAAKLGAAAKKPGGRALLLVLALCGFTALGAAVFNLANNGEAQNVGGAASGRAAAAWTGATGGTGEGTGGTGATGASPASPARPSVSDFSTERTQQEQTMNATIQRTFAVPLAALALTANAYETAITDTTGYVVQNASDGYNQNSLVAGTHFPGGAPVAGKHYLVNNGLTNRSPATAGNYVFKGDSLSLDGGATFLLKANNSAITVADLRVYNAFVSQGDGKGGKRLKGGISVFGTPEAPSVFIGSGNAGTRRIYVDADISGASGTGIKIMHSGDADADGEQFYTYFLGDNSGYAGAIEVEGGGNGICLVGVNANSFGSSPRIALSNGGKLFGGGDGGSFSLSGASITLSGGGVLGVYKAGSNNVGLEITGGSTISGSGTLKIANSGFEGAHARRVALGNVAISGIDGISVDGGVLQLNAGYANPSVPISVASPVLLRVMNGVSAGPVALGGGASLNTANTSATLASLTLSSAGGEAPFIRKFLSSGLVTITGGLVNDLGAGEKIRIDFSGNSETPFASTTSFRILSAANLGDAGVTAADFAATADDADEFLRDYLTNGAFSIEESGGKKYLVYTLAKKAVYSTGTDGYSENSLVAGTRWSDKATPHDDADYFVQSGHQIRSKRYASSTFDGHSLSVLSGGKLAVQGQASGVKTTISDLRLYGGGILTTTTDWGNTLDGAVEIGGSAADPVIFETAWASTSASADKTGRHLTISAPVSGSGALLCRYQAGDFDVAHPAGLNLRGDNTGFTGQWQIGHPAAQATFASAANFGSASALVFCSNGVFKAVEGSFALPAATEVVVRNDGAVVGGEELTNGGTISVDEGLTLTVPGVVSGAGVLRKTGGGTLLLDGANTLSGTLEVRAGLLGGVGSVESVSLVDGAGFVVDATQATPFEIGTLALNGDVAIEITDYAAGSFDRVAVANVGAISGELPQTAVPATLNGRAKNNVTLSYSGGVLYAGLTSPFILVVR